ncbi:MAG: tRNA pseudouridine(13) synthase TruD [Candidatus Micrarchaeota archaeon]|nr:tRNA pseudouridine(13) synthase TruD [Candidatus Micrarchaeota archaeon]
MNNETSFKIESYYANFFDGYNKIITNRKPNSIKTSPNNFIVEEINTQGTVIEIGNLDKFFCSTLTDNEYKNKHLYFVLKKINWETTSALKAIAKKLKISYKRFSFAGTKDRKATTTQICSVYNLTHSELLSVNNNLKDIEVYPLRYCDTKIKLGDLLGNKFIIVLEKAIEEDQINIFKNSKIIPNYFGEQRFGFRLNSHVIGKFILQNKLKEAVVEFLCGSPLDEIQQAKESRNRLYEDMDFKKALNYFPKYLKHERRVLNYLCQNSSDYTNALRKLPRQTLLMFVHAYQSYLFNKVLKERLDIIIKDKKLELYENEYFAELDNLMFPVLERKSTSTGIPVMQVLGYETKTLNEIEKKILEDEYIKLQDFKINHFPELNAKGSKRAMLIISNDFSYVEDKKTAIFSLPKGSYATTLINYLCEVNPLFYNELFRLDSLQ